MALIADHALIGDCHSAALVCRDGPIDWLCLPRFDSPACFAALLGTRDNGSWRIAPAGVVTGVQRQYRGDTMVLERGFNPALGAFTQTLDGTALDAGLLLLPLVGFLPPDDPRIAGTVAAIGRDLTVDGLIQRYDTNATVDGMPPGEGSVRISVCEACSVSPTIG